MLDINAKPFSGIVSFPPSNTWSGSLVGEESKAERDHNSWVGSSAVILHSNADRIVYFLLIYPPRIDVPKDGLGIPVLEKKLRNLALMVT